MINLKKLLVKILERLQFDKSFVVTEEFLYTSDAPLTVAPGGSTSELTKTFTKEGYYPVGIVGWEGNGAGSTWMNFNTLRMSNQETGTATVRYGIRNYSTATATLSPSISILWAKTY